MHDDNLYGLISLNLNYANQTAIFLPKDKQPVLYIDPFVDNREFTLKLVEGGSRNGRFKEDPTLIHFYKYFYPLQTQGSDVPETEPPRRYLLHPLLTYLRDLKIGSTPLDTPI